MQPPPWMMYLCAFERFCYERTTPIKSNGGLFYMRKKQQCITFRVTNEEFEMIKEKARELNLTMTDFIVMCCQEKVITKSEC